MEAKSIVFFLPKQFPDFYVSEHFSLDEFRCPCCDLVVLDPALPSALEQFRQIIDCPIKVWSGFRCPDHNRHAGGSKWSKHMLGQGADITASKYSPEELYCLARASELFTGLGIYKTHVHVDVRPGALVTWDRR